ncbi:MAG TPA: hypothetical protein VGC34_15555, partial [Steroidobacteraceae bacterium]
EGADGGLRSGRNVAGGALVARLEAGPGGGGTEGGATVSARASAPAARTRTGTIQRRLRPAGLAAKPLDSRPMMTSVGLAMIHAIRFTAT